MKILNCYYSVKGIITKLSIILCLGLCLNLTSYSNPIIPPPMILEIHFGSNGWSMEMLNQGYYGEDNLDNVWLIGLYDAAHFKPGISFAYEEVTVVTQDDFTDPSFIINQAGDWLTLWYNDGNGFSEIDYYGLAFGDIPDSLIYLNKVSAPVGEESIGLQLFYNLPYGGTDYWVVKELPNTIGYSPWQVSKRAEFSGYVKDINDAPLKNIELQYCWDPFHYASPAVPVIVTDENGYFFTDNMFCRNYTINFLYEEGEIGDTAIFIEPDSANYFEFKLDTLLTGIAEFKPAISSYSISNIPNPYSAHTTFVVESKGFEHYQKGIIKIYNTEGFIVDILPMEISGEKQELNYNPTDKSLPAGIYYYSLEIGRKKVASGKMVISL